MSKKEEYSLELPQTPFDRLCGTITTAVMFVCLEEENVNEPLAASLSQGRGKTASQLLQESK